MDTVSRVSPFAEGGNKHSGSTLMFGPPLIISNEIMTLMIEATIELVMVQ